MKITLAIFATFLWTLGCIKLGLYLRRKGEWFDNAYVVEYWCRNCGFTGDLMVRKGVSKLAVGLDDSECQRCGCKELSKR